MPFTNAINGALKHFCGKNVGGIQHLEDRDSDLIYLIHDNATIKSVPWTLEGKPLKTIKKPDIIGTSLAHLASLRGDEYEAKSLSATAEDIEKHPDDWLKARKAKKSRWADCYHVCELKRVVSMEAVFPHYKRDGVMGSGEFFSHFFFVIYIV